VSGGSLLDDNFFTVGSLDLKVTTFDVLLGVIPSTTGVGGGESDLDTGDNATSEDTVGSLVTEESSTDEG